MNPNTITLSGPVLDDARDAMLARLSASVSRLDHLLDAGSTAGTGRMACQVAVQEVAVMAPLAAKIGADRATGPERVILDVREVRALAGACREDAACHADGSATDGLSPVDVEWHRARIAGDRRVLAALASGVTA